MIATRALRIGLCATMLGIGAVAGGLGGTTLASAATPKIVVTPATNLHNGEAVHVRGTGFKPGDTVFLVECLRAAKGESGCKVANGIPPSETITSSGLLPRTTFKVSTGKIGTGTCGRAKANLKNCAVSVGNATGGDSAVGDITFALPTLTPKIIVTPATNLHNGEAVHVRGTGFKPGDTVFLVECLRAAKGESGCKVANGIPPSETITSSGLLPRTTFKVSTGKIGTGTCGRAKANLKNCAVSVGNATGGDSAVGDITFALPAQK